MIKIILVTLNVVTGILISKVLFSSLGVSENGLGVFYKFVATWSLIIISVHIGLHLQIIINKLKKALKITKSSVVAKIAPKY